MSLHPCRHRNALGFVLVPLVALGLAACGGDDSTGPDDGNQTTTVTLDFSSQPNAAIPDDDATGINDEINISSSGTIQDVIAEVDINHAWVGDLRVTLEHANTGTTVTLIDMPNEGNGDCAGQGPWVELDDSATEMIQTSCTDSDPAYPQLTYQPAGSLSSFDGESPSGTWRLNVSDNQLFDEGDLEDWSITLTVEQQQ